jgi:proteasome lid subunit RPN8/RPN11
MDFKPSSVVIDEEALGFLFAYARGAYPREAIVALKGGFRRNGEVEVNECVLPMKRVEGHGFSTWAFMGVADSKTVGIGHSHPSGVIRPSNEDLLNFFGKILLIVGPPYSSEQNAGFFNKQGEKIPFSVKWKSLDKKFKL